MRKPGLRINVTNQPEEEALFSARTTSLREHILTRLLGPLRRVTILVPGNQVGKLEIVEPAEDMTALAEAVGVMGGGSK